MLYENNVGIDSINMTLMHSSSRACKGRLVEHLRCAPVRTPLVVGSSHQRQGRDVSVLQLSSADRNIIDIQ
jgi:hypothetical protein